MKFVTPNPRLPTSLVKHLDTEYDEPMRPKTESQLVLSDDHLVADFPYSAEQVKEIKNVGGASWDKVARVWRIPMSSIDQARTFAERNDFWISPEVMKFTLPALKSLGESRVTLADDHIQITFPYDPVKIEAIRRISGSNFSKKRGLWVAPFTVTGEIIEFAAFFDLLVDQEVINKQREDAAAESTLIKLSASVDADIELPELGGTLRPYQKAGIAYALNAKKCFIADEMGTGKTIQSLVALETEDAFPAIVVCPPTLTLNWKAEANKWLPHRTVSVISNRKDFPEPADITVVGWSNISHWVEKLSDASSYVFDESHYAKSPDAQRTKAAVKMAKNADGLVLCLTGTPITNRPAEYVPQLEIIGQLKNFGGKWGFYKRYCGAFRDRWGVWHTDGAAHLEELNDKLRASCYIRRTKEQVLDDLPPMLHTKILVTPDEKVMKEYRKAEDDIVRYMADRAAEIAKEMGMSPKSAAVIAKLKAEANEHLVRIAALRRLAAMAKMKAVDEWVENLLETGAKVVLAAHHRDVVDRLSEKYGGLKIQGGMLVSEVEDHKSRFQNDPASKVMTISIQAAKTGHTLTAAQDIAFVELPFTPADLDQTAARCHRIGQLGVVTSHYLLAAGTIDEKLYDLIERKRSVVDAATEGGTVDEAFSIGTQLIADYAEMGLAD
jgi:SNF2 family DNA or RNA helicase